MDILGVKNSQIDPNKQFSLVNFGMLSNKSRPLLVAALKKEPQKTSSKKLATAATNCDLTASVLFLPCQTFLKIQQS